MSEPPILLVRCALHPQIRDVHPNVAIDGASFPDSGAMAVGLVADDRSLMHRLAHVADTVDGRRDHLVHRLPGAYVGFIDYDRLLNGQEDGEELARALDRQGYVHTGGSISQDINQYRGRWRDEHHPAVAIDRQRQRARFYLQVRGIDLDHRTLETIPRRITLCSIAVPLQLLITIPS